MEMMMPETKKMQGMLPSMIVLRKLMRTRSSAKDPTSSSSLLIKIKARLNDVRRLPLLTTLPQLRDSRREMRKSVKLLSKELSLISRSKQRSRRLEKSRKDRSSSKRNAKSKTSCSYALLSSSSDLTDSLKMLGVLSSATRHSALRNLSASLISIKMVRSQLKSLPRF